MKYLLILIITLPILSFGQPDKIELHLQKRWKNWQSLTLDTIKYQPIFEQKSEFIKTAKANLNIFIQNTGNPGYENLVDSIVHKVNIFPSKLNTNEEFKDYFITLNEAYLFDSTMSNIYLAFGKIYESFGRREKAAEIYEKGIEVDSSNVELLIRLSYVYRQIDNHKQFGFEYLETALKYLKRALEIAPINSIEFIRILHQDVLIRLLNDVFVKHDLIRTKKYRLEYKNFNYDKISVKRLEMIDYWIMAENNKNGDTIKMKIIGVNDSMGLQIVKYSSLPINATENNLSKYYLRWNNNQDSILFLSHTLSLSTISHFERSFGFYLLDTCIISLKQLDEQGHPEVIIKHNINRKTLTTIVNINNGIIMFNSINANSVTYFLNTSYGSDFNNYSACSYAYEISFDNDNNLIIHNLIQKGGLYPAGPKRDKHKGKRDYLFIGCHPDKKQGVYVLENGIYTYSEDKSKELKKQQ